MAPRLHLGINTCFAVKRWPEPDRWAGLIVDELGLEHCQVSLDLFDPGLDLATTAPAVDAGRDAAAAVGLEVHGTFTGLAAYSGNLLLHPAAAQRAAAERWFGRAIELTARLGARGTGGFLGALSMADAADEKRRRFLVEDLGNALARLGARAVDEGLEMLLFENMAVGREYGTRIDEARAIEETAGPPWRLCLDLGHPCALPAGPPDSDPLAWLAAPWQRVPVLQVQQANRAGDFHWPFTEEKNRQGSLRADDVVDTLCSWTTHGDVYLFLEVIHPAEYPDALVLRELAESVAHWRAAIARRSEETRAGAR